MMALSHTLQEVVDAVLAPTNQSYDVHFGGLYA